MSVTRYTVVMAAVVALTMAAAIAAWAVGPGRHLPVVNSVAQVVTFGVLALLCVVTVLHYGNSAAQLQEARDLLGIAKAHFKLAQQQAERAAKLNAAAAAAVRHTEKALHDSGIDAASRSGEYRKASLLPPTGPTDTIHG
jgi:hypothetical protein